MIDVMISLKSLEACLDVVENKHGSEMNNGFDVSGIVSTADEKVRFLESLLVLLKEIPVESDHICLYLLHQHPIGREIIQTTFLLCNGSEERADDVVCQLRIEISSLFDRIFSKEEEENELNNKGLTNSRLLTESRSILLFNIAVTFLEDFDKCYRLGRKNQLRRRINLLKSDGKDADGGCRFSHYCDKVRSLWSEERCLRFQRFESKWATDLFALYWEILVCELESIMDGYVTLSPAMEDACGTRSNARFFGGSVSLRSSGEILVSNEYDSRHQALGQCRNYPLCVKTILRLVQNCWSLEKFMLSSLRNPNYKIYTCDEDVLWMKSHPYSDYNGSTEPTMNSNWRSLFLPFLGDLIDTIDREISFDTSVAIQEEWDRLQISTATQVIDETVFITDSNGIRILHSVWTLCEAATNYLPLAELAGSRLSSVRVSFVDRIRGQCTEIQNHLLKIGRLVPHSASVSVLYVSLGSILKLKTVLKECHEKLESEDLEYVCYELEKVEYSLIEQVTIYHHDVIANCILQDDEAHNWESSKPFYENECCSFSIHQWYLHLLALRHDLWSAIPSIMSVNIFTRVLENSLRILARRYSAVRPSFVRTKQMQADIVAILLCTSHLLEFSLSSLSEFFSVAQNVDDSTLYRNIHNLCTSLAATLIIVTAPLQSLYKVFKKGFTVSDTSKKDGYHWNWLTIVQNAGWREFRNEYDRNTTLSLSIHLKLLCNQPTDGNWLLLLQVLFGVEHAVARLFLVFPSIASLTDPTASSVPSSSSDDMIEAFDSVECFKSLMYTKPDFFTDHVNTRNENVFGLDVISDLLGTFINSVVKVIALFLVPFVDLNDACLRRISKLVHDGPEFDFNETVIETIQLFLSILPTNFAFIPDPLCHLLIKLQELEDHSAKDTSHCLPFRFLCAVHGFVLSPNASRWYFDTTLKPGLAMNIFSQVSKLLLYLGGVNSIELDISADLSSRLIGLRSSIDNANEHVHRYFALSSKNIHSCNGSDNLGVIVNLVSYPKGIESLRCLRRFLVHYKDWFLVSLGQFKSGIKSKSCKTIRNSTFNPFEHFGSIGDTGYTFDQESLVKEIRVDWERLIKENLFVSKVALSTLLSHRWEFNLETDLDASNLESNERKYVSVLRELFICTS